MTPLWALGITAALVIVLLVLERRPQMPRALYGSVKILASSVFVAFGVGAVQRDAQVDAADAALLAALALSFVGDALLVPRGSKGLFLAGLSSFLLGHGAYVGAFVARGVDNTALIVAGGVALAVGLGVVRWLHPHLRGPMAIAVPIYVLVIGAMVSAAVAAVVAAQLEGRAAPRALLVLGTVCFWVSDLAVARERFVASGYINRFVGIPLYFLAQLAIVAGFVP
jgi:uncharacterized membrane protein YhhN